MNQPEGPGLPGPSSGPGPRTEHGDFHYDIAATTRAGKQRVHPYASEEPLEVGQIVRLEGRYWLIESIEDSRAAAKPARYRLNGRHVYKNSAALRFGRLPACPEAARPLGPVRSPRPRRPTTLSECS